MVSSILDLKQMVKFVGYTCVISDDFSVSLFRFIELDILVLVFHSLQLNQREIPYLRMGIVSCLFAPKMLMATASLY